MKNKLINNILPMLLSGDKNKKECTNEILNHFSDFYKLHNRLKEGDAIIFNGNSGTLIKKGDRKSIIKWETLGYLNTEKEEEVYNIEFFKEPKDYWAFCYGIIILHTT